jgi:arylesterase/paraoxonase
MWTAAKRGAESEATAGGRGNAPRATASVKVANLRPIWLNGTEDIAIDHQSGWAYVSSQVYQTKAKLKPQGAIYGLDLEQDEPQPINLTAPLLDLAAGSGTSDTERRPLIRPNGAFHPHGISLYASGGEEMRLFVINHDDDEHTRVEIFAAAGPRLTHLRTIADDAHLTSPNDLLAVGSEEFYLSNDHGFRVQPLQLIEDLLHLQRGSVVYFDGREFKTFASGIAYANGLALSPDGKTLYVAAMDAQQILAFPRDPQRPEAAPAAARDIPLPDGPDNLEWDADGALWTGAQCDRLKLAPYYLGQVAYAPSKVLRIADPSAANPTIEVVWEDDGRILSAASVAAVYRRRDDRRRLLIGAPFDDRMLIGDLT